MSGFPYSCFYTAGPEVFTNFDELSEIKKLETQRKVSATNKLREQFRKEVPELAEKMASRLNKKSESN